MADDSVDPTINGSDLFAELEPVLDEQSINYDDFINKIALKISTYISAEDMLTGVYAGIIPGTPPIPSTEVVANAKLVPLSIDFAPPMPFDFVNWFKQTLNSFLTWNLTALPPHTFTPIQLIPLASTIDIYGNSSSLKDIRTAKGFWALICDAIVWSILSSVTRVTPINATAIDGSSGIITWIPLNLPEFKQNFIFTIHYDATNTQLVRWLQDHGVDTSHLVGDVDVPINNQLYQVANIAWLALKAITEKCKFYKKQDNGSRVLLAVGSDL